MLKVLGAARASSRATSCRAGAIRRFTPPGAYQLRRRREERGSKEIEPCEPSLSTGWRKGGPPEQPQAGSRAETEPRLRAVGCRDDLRLHLQGSATGRAVMALPRRRHHKRRRPRRSRPSQDTIKDRVSIHERPKHVEARTEGGHWEGDLIICKRTRPVLVLHERKSRVTLAARLAGKTAAETISVMLAVFARVDPALRKSITFDNDTAFAQHSLLRTMRAMTTWFCDRLCLVAKGRGRKCQRSITTLVAASDRHRQSVRPGNPGHRHHRQSHAQKMPWLQNSFSGNPQRPWQRRANPVHVKLCCTWL